MNSAISHISGEKLTEIVGICIDKCLGALVTENNGYSEYLYHATPSCYVNSIKKYGLGAKFPKKRMWDYSGTEYDSIKRGVFLATDEYVAESYVESSDYFDELSDKYEERYGKELKIVIFRIKKNDLNKSLLSVDSNQMYNNDSDKTLFYDGIIPYNMLEIIDIY